MLNDSAVRDGGKLHIFTAPVGTAHPTQAMLDTFNSDTGSGNEAQTITITGSPTDGTFTLTYDSQTTGAIDFDATAAEVQTALEALSNLAVGDVSVTGGPLPGTAVVVTFQGTLAGTDVELMTADDTGLTGGTTPEVTVTTSTTSWAPWTNLGHTDLEEDVTVEEEGGESTVRGSRQNPALRETVSPVTQAITLNAIQIDTATLGLYFGDATITTGVMSTNGTFAGSELAVLLVFDDEGVVSGVHYPKANIRRGGPPSMAAGSFRRLPIRITPLKLTGQPLQRWIDPAIVAA